MAKIITRKKAPSAGLWLILRNAAGEEVERRHAEDEMHAVRVAILMLANRYEMNDGDVLMAKREPAKILPLR